VDLVRCRHGDLVSFFFNAPILGFAINVTAGMIGGG
jgi:uncharacterized membrane protein